MNLTVLSLFLSSTSLSPVFCQNHVTLRSVQLSRHFSPLVYGLSNRLQYLSLARSHFSHVLSPVVNVISGAEYQNKKFTSTLYLDSSERSFYVEDCTFIDCRNSDGNGGGISVNANQATLKVTRCGFRDCRADVSGGAIYTDIGYVDLVSTCATKCVADKYPAFHLTAVKEVTMSQCHVTRFDSDDCRSACTTMICDQDSAMKNANFSGNSMKRANGIFAFYVKTLKAQYMHFEDNKCGCAMHVKAASSTRLENANFVGNEAADYLIEIDKATYSITFANFYFKNDKSAFYINKYCTFDKCYFEEEQSEAEKRFTGGSPQVKDCTFGSKETGDMHIVNSQICWGKPDTPVPTAETVETVKRELTIGVAFGIAFVLMVVGIAGYVFWQRRCRRNFQDTHRLVYV